MSTDKKEIVGEIEKQIEFYNSMQQLVNDCDKLSKENATLTVSIKLLTEERDVLVAENTDLLEKETALNRVGKNLQLKLNNFKALIEEKNGEIRDLKKKNRRDGKLKPIHREAEKIPVKESVNHLVVDNKAGSTTKRGILIIAEGISGIDHKLKNLQGLCSNIEWVVKKVDGKTTRDPKFLDGMEVAVILVRGQKHKHTDWFRGEIHKKGIPCFVGNGVSIIAENINRDRTS